MRGAGHLACMGEIRNLHEILVGKPKVKRSRRKWEDNIRTDLKEIRALIVQSV
jgi:hypothetical protein